jgi:hypothetical protein
VSFSVTLNEREKRMEGKIGKATIMMAMLLMSMALIANLATVKASGTIYIRADGLIDQPSKRWIQMFPSSRPSARVNHAMAYDSANNVVILFGGRDAKGSFLHDTWAYELSTNTWINMTSDTHPPARDGAMMAYDSDNNVVVMFGGVSAAGFLDDTWTYSFSNNTWTQKFPTTKPAARGNTGGMAYDSFNKVMVIFGGYNGWWFGDTWIYNVSGNTWVQKFPTTSPPPRTGGILAYDGDDKVIVMFGGAYAFATTYDDTWVYDVSSNTWTQKFPAERPIKRAGHGLAYDNIDKVVVLFGGFNYEMGRFNDTWTYSVPTNIWTNITSTLTIAPPARGWGGGYMVYNSADNVHILFGDQAEPNKPFDDTWVFGGAKELVPVPGTFVTVWNQILQHGTLVPSALPSLSTTVACTKCGMMLHQFGFTPLSRRLLPTQRATMESHGSTNKRFMVQWAATMRQESLGL